jgi:hypothetical protein
LRWVELESSKEHGCSQAGTRGAACGTATTEDANWIWKETGRI